MGSCVSRDKKNGKQPFKKAAEGNRERRERHEQRVEALYRRALGEAAWIDDDGPPPPPYPTDVDEIRRSIAESGSSMTPTNFSESPRNSILVSSEPGSPSRRTAGSVVFVTRNDDNLDGQGNAPSRSPRSMHGSVPFGDTTGHRNSQGASFDLPFSPITPTSPGIGDGQRTFLPGAITGIPEVDECELPEFESTRRGSHLDNSCATAEPQPGSPTGADVSFETSFQGVPGSGLARSDSTDNLGLSFGSQTQSSTQQALLPMNDDETRPWRVKIARRCVSAKFHNIGLKNATFQQPTEPSPSQSPTSQGA